jgi:hypothetical protein
MRLIDADTLIKDLSYLYTKNHIPVDMRARETLSTVMEQPTAYDVDKVVEQLENERKFWENAYDSNLGKEKARSYEHAIGIVKAGGIVSNQDNMDERR